MQESTTGSEVDSEYYTVILHRNNSANDGATSKWTTFEVGVARALPTASSLNWAPRSGYTFLGWAKSATATTAQYTDGQSVKDLTKTKGATVHLYAVWKKNAPENYTVILHRNNSANDGATSKWTTFKVGIACALPTASSLKWAPRDGYTFLGWAKSATATTAQYTDGQSVKDLTKTKGATVDLYAVWQGHKYTVRLHRNNSATDGSTAGREFTVGTSRALPTASSLNWAPREGYTFLGWAKSATATTAQYTDGQSVKDLTKTKGATVDLYAVWQGHKYTVRLHRNYSANDGSTAGREFTVGMSRALPTASSLNWAPRSGYTFLGWAKSATATTAQYTDGQSVKDLTKTKGATVDLYAVWKKNVPENYTVILHRNNSVNDGATSKWTTFKVGIACALPTASTLKWAPREGYTFLGWAKSATATTAQYKDGQSVSLSSTKGATVDLYAVWQGHKYTVRLHRNTSAKDGAMPGYSFTVGKSQALPTAIALKWTPREDYDFLGWAKSATATTAQYKDGQSVKNLTTTKDATVHLYAVWRMRKYTVRLHRNTSAKDGAMPGYGFIVGKSQALPTASALKWAPREGYTFLGWAKSSTATTAQYKDGQSVSLSSTVGATVDLYAVWRARKYTVRLHRNFNADDGATAGRSFTIGKSQALPTASSLKWAPRTDYDFLGWAKSATATTAQYKDGQSVMDLTTTVGATVHLYAVWKVRKYTVRLHRNHSANDGATTPLLDFTMGRSQALPTASSLKWAPREGYTFLGWAKSAAATAAQYTDGQSVLNLTKTKNATVDLYAVWKVHKYIVRLHRNNSPDDGATTGCSFTVGQSRALPKVSALKWLRSDHDFVGWATAANATTAQYGDGQSLKDLTKTENATVHLYAVWKAKTYTVRLHRVAGANDTATAGRTFAVGKGRALPTAVELKWSRPGYTFIGWATADQRATAKYWDGQTVSGLTNMPGATVHLYAVWVAGEDKYAVRLHRNLSSSDGATAGRTFTVGKGRALPTPTELNWSRPGYDFLGWATAENATAAKYNGGQTVADLSTAPGATVHLYAVWRAGTYVVRLYRNYSPDDGATTGRTITIDQGRALPTVSELGWTRKGYTFAAWLCPSGKDVKAFSDGQNVSGLTSQQGTVIEVYAVWR